MLETKTAPIMTAPPPAIDAGLLDPSGLLYGHDPDFAPGKTDISLLPVLPPLRSMMKVAAIVDSTGMINISHEKKLPEPPAWVEIDADMGWLDIVTWYGNVQPLGYALPVKWFDALIKTTEIGIYHLDNNKMWNAGIYTLLVRRIGV